MKNPMEVDVQIEVKVRPEDAEREYTREEVQRLFPIAYRKAQQRARAEHLKNMKPAALKFGKVTLSYK